MTGIKQAQAWADEVFHLQTINTQLLEALRDCASIVQDVAIDGMKMSMGEMRQIVREARAAVKAATEAS